MPPPRRAPRTAEVVREQHGRCALCGSILSAAVGAHVDHKVPVALRGKSEIGNYQLLCAECNLGKSKMPGWILAAPFLREGHSPRMKYCVLTRFHGRCCERSCLASASTTEIHAMPRVPVSRGGRIIFDNLEALCSEHADLRREKWLKEANARAEMTPTMLRWQPA